MTSMSWSGRSTSAKTRPSGSANEVAVYSMRAVCSSRPQPHASARARPDARRGGLLTAASAIAARTAITSSERLGSHPRCRRGRARDRREAASLAKLASAHSGRPAQRRREQTRGRRRSRRTGTRAAPCRRASTERPRGLGCARPNGAGRGSRCRAPSRTPRRSGPR